MTTRTKWGGTLGGLGTIVGIPIAVYGAVLARRQPVAALMKATNT